LEGSGELLESGDLDAAETQLASSLDALADACVGLALSNDLEGTQLKEELDSVRSRIKDQRGELEQAQRAASHWCQEIRAALKSGAIEDASQLVADVGPWSEHVKDCKLAMHAYHEFKAMRARWCAELERSLKAGDLRHAVTVCARASGWTQHDARGRSALSDCRAKVASRDGALKPVRSMARWFLPIACLWPENYRRLERVLCGLDVANEEALLLRRKLHTTAVVITVVVSLGLVVLGFALGFQAA
jgi:hypothetical protein